ncbi:MULTISPECIES: DMT family protein [Acinetobacter]|uniref:DMT family protein n=1 Tax=Acinetobacter TaxID=469 RepID=UPI00148E6663|nr:MULTISPECIES: DMT family protein [Acinetobacter]WLF72494.1 DMT family protein [Acinetobacter junii]
MYLSPCCLYFPNQKDAILSPTLLALCLLIISNCFMTLAWYGHLKILHDAPLWQAILFSWCIALLEYSFMIPATKLLNQYGWSLGEMKITQEVVTLLVFVPFMIFLFKQPFKLDYIWAMLCLLGCVYFVFRNQS